MRQPRPNHASQKNSFYSQNPANTDYYQPTQMQNEIPLPYYLQQHEITKNQLKIFSQMPNAAESLQMTMNPYLMGGSSITSDKPLNVFTGTDPEYSVADYLNAVTASLMKKDQNLSNKNIHSNRSSGKPLPNNSNYSRNQSPYNSSYRGRSPEQRKLRKFSQNRYSRSNSQNNQYRNNYSQSNSNRTEFFDTISHSNSRNYRNNRNRNYSNNRNQRYQNNRSRNNSYKRSNLSRKQ